MLTAGQRGEMREDVVCLCSQETQFICERSGDDEERRYVPSRSFFVFFQETL